MILCPKFSRLGLSSAQQWAENSTDEPPPQDPVPVEPMPVEAMPVEAMPMPDDAMQMPVEAMPVEAMPVEAMPMADATPIEAAPVEAAAVEAAPVAETAPPPPPAPAAAPAAPAAAFPAGTIPSLVALRSQKPNTVFPLCAGQNFIGRADDRPVDVDLDGHEPEDKVFSSRQHAVINFDDTAMTLVLEDLNSANGTYLNRNRVYPGQPQPLKPGDVIQIGTVQLRVKA